MTRISKWIPAMTVAGLLFMSADLSAQQTVNIGKLTEGPSFVSDQQARGAIARSYPRNHEGLRIGGTVRVRFLVDAEGNVSSQSVDIIAASSKVVADAAASAVTNIQFVPGKRDGSATSTLVEMPIRYVVH